MKLFSKTLLFFIGVVFFQGTLTIFLVTGIITRNNAVDARVELEKEAAIVYENYNSWVRAVWETTIRIAEDDDIKTSLESDPGSARESNLEKRLEEILISSRMESIILRTSSGLYNYINPSGAAYFSLMDLNRLKSIKNHPYVELIEINSDIYLAGVLRLGGQEGDELFILKRIDKNFLMQLPMQERSVVFISSYSHDGSGNLMDGNIFKEYINSSLMNIPYTEVYNLEVEKGSYNAAFQKIGRLNSPEDKEDLFLVLLMSNEPYLSILSKINKTVLNVSIIVGLITILLSFYFSRRITHPISRLIIAMNAIREGDYNIKVDKKSGSELNMLIHGFNEMASHLNLNKITMDNNIHEITFLKDYNEKIIHSIQAGIVVLGSDLSIEKVNSFFLESFKKTESDVLGKNIWDLSLEVIDSSIMKNIRYIISGEARSWSKIKRTKSIVYEIKLYPLYTVRNDVNGQCVLEINDVSKKYELEEKIFQAEKLSSLSILSAGVSHEINNPLSSIMTNVQNLLAEESDKEVRTSLMWIEQETRRIAKIVRELLDFSSSDRGGGKGVLVNPLILDVVRLINYSLVKEGRIKIICDLADSLPKVSISSNELKQVIINLIQNSVHAIEGDGTINISTTLSDNNKNVIIQVGDTGSGIDEANMLHIFDPFFTTKANGKGTGLGLSIVYGIVNKYSGTVDVNSMIAKGAIITLTFPVCEDPG